jgi:hypothetical protein
MSGRRLTQDEYAQLQRTVNQAIDHQGELSLYNQGFIEDIFNKFAEHEEDVVLTDAQIAHLEKIADELGL